MYIWKKCCRKHAHADKYDYFLQGIRSVRWALPYKRLIKDLEDMLGPYETFKHLPKDHWAGYKRVLNEKWYVDRDHQRIYITEKALVLYNLKH